MSSNEETKLSDIKPTLKEDSVLEGSDAAVSATVLSDSTSPNQPATTNTNKIQKTTPNEQEFVLPYRPYASTEKWLEHRFSAWSAPKTWFATILLVSFFGFGGPGKVIELIIQTLTKSNPGSFSQGLQQHAISNLLIVQYMSWILVFFFSAVAIMYLRHPSSVVLNAEGISLVWKRGLEWLRTTVKWKDLQRIGIEWPQNKTSPQDCLICFSQIDGEPLKFKYGALPTIDDRQSVMDAINRWAPHASRAPELADMLSKPHTQGYTELWLQALSQPPKRERLTPLTEGSMLRNSQFEILGRLGVGGQGTAYLAREIDNNQAVVLKEFILPVYVDVNVRRQSVEKMQNEATILSRLNHEQIVKLIDFFIEDHRGYLVLERIDGESLRQKISRDGKLDEDEVRNLALQMCEMLKYLHGLEPPVVHRDFTPENLILGRDGVLKLVDFNVAQQQESTATGTVVGKHSFIAPEQFRGKPTPQSDIYSMGATLHYLLAGADPEPITCSHPKELVETVSEQMNEVVAKSTALSVKNRFSTASEIVEALTGQS